MKFLAVMCIFSIFCSVILYSAEFQPPPWAEGKTLYEVNLRQYSKEGSFEAFRQHLPRLQEMGVGILWLMPINPIGELKRKGSLGSYYSISDYTKLNPEFGSEKEFKSLVDEIHQRGMYVIIDWVANHTSWDNVWTKSHPDYYKKDTNGNFYPPVKDWADVIQLDYSSRGLRKEMIAAMNFWVNDFDIDGFRCDVAEMVPLDFWMEAREELQKSKPLFMLAECENPAYHQAFDMTYAWSSHQLFKDIAAGRKQVIELDAYRMREMRRFDKNELRMHFLSNHDENSWSGTMLDHFPGSYKAFTVLTYALPGMPLIYSGQEALNRSQLQFFEKDEIIWQKTEMEDLYTRLNALRNDQPALHNGRIIRLGNSSPYQVFSIIRQSGDSKVLFVINLSGEEAHTRLRVADGNWYDFMNEKKLLINNQKKILLPAYSCKILIKI